MSGIPYQGSKSTMARKLIEQLPNGNRFVDLLGGGGAMTDEAIKSNKYKSFLYNDFNPLIVDLFSRAISGGFNPETFKPRFVTRDEFNKKKDKDGYIKYIWSFGNNGKGYIFGKNKEEYKRQAHNYIVFNCNEGLKYLENIFKNSYYWHIKNIKTRKDFVRIILKIETIRVTTLYNKKVYDYYEHLSYEELYNVKESDIIDKINELIPNVKYKYCKSNRKEVKRLEQFQNFQQLEQLQNFERLKQLQRLESLKKSNITTTNNSYLDYEYQEGDVVYCDPPYEGAAIYNSEKFNHQEFYDWVYNSKFPIYFSSYEISDNRFQVIWSKEKRNLMAQGASDVKKLEKLYWNGNKAN